MNTKAFVHKMLQDMQHRDGGYDIRTIVFSTLPWPSMEECRAILTDGTIFSAIFEDGEKLSPFVEIPKEQK